MTLLQAVPSSGMTENTYKIWTLIFYGIQAVGTIVVALLAIYGERIIRKLFKPKLTIEINSKAPFVELVKEQTTQSSSTTEHIRISTKITNTGDTTAQNCQGIIEKILCKRKANESYYCFKSFIPSRFMWNDEKESSFVTPEIPSYLEIAKIQQTEDLTSNETPSAKDKVVPKKDYELFLTIEEPNEKGKYLKLGKGTFLLPIVIYTDNLRRTQKVYIEIYWNGKELNSITESNFYVKIIPNTQITKEIIAL